MTTTAYRTPYASDPNTCAVCWGIIPPEGVTMVPDDGAVCDCPTEPRKLAAGQLAALEAPPAPGIQMVEASNLIPDPIAARDYALHNLSRQES